MFVVKKKVEMRNIRGSEKSMNGKKALIFFCLLKVFAVEYSFVSYKKPVWRNGSATVL